MSYSIEYSPQKNNRYPAKKEKTNKLPILLGIVFCMVLVYCFTAFDISGLTRRYFAELDAMAVRLRDGTEIGQAIAAYYSQMLLNAQIG